MNNKGITLIALIVTVVILLIIASVTIMVVYQTGMIDSTERAVQSQVFDGSEYNLMLSRGGTSTSIIDILDSVSGTSTVQAKVNPPELLDGMVPVQWNGSNWVKADASNSNWYAYGTTQATKRWANAVTVKENGTKSRSYYLSGEATGKVVADEDILGMYVWIPRFRYQLNNSSTVPPGGTIAYHQGAADGFDGNSSSTSEVIQIQFLLGTDAKYNGTACTIYDAQRTTLNDVPWSKFPGLYVVHPAFTTTYAHRTGFWVAKFEASSSTTMGSVTNTGNKYGRNSVNPDIGDGKDEVTIRPNVTSWRSITVSNAEIACMNMVEMNNIHGLQYNEENKNQTVSAHLINDYEWGAVAYLAQSAYGNPQTSPDTGVWNNCFYEGDAQNTGASTYSGYSFYCTSRTGMVGIKEGQTTGRDNAAAYYGVATSTSSTNSDGSFSITYDVYSKNNGKYIDYTMTYYPYNTTIGQNGSTTGTIYGVYDMAGGAYEFTASYLSESSSTYATYFNTFDSSTDKYKYMKNFVTKYSGNYMINTEVEYEGETVQGVYR